MTSPRMRSEIQATPRPGTAVAADDGIVMVIDTDLTDDLRAEGDARELTRALQDLRRQARAGPGRPDRGLARRGPRDLGRASTPHLDGVTADVLADAIHAGAPPDGRSVAERRPRCRHARVSDCARTNGTGTAR